MSTDLLDLRFRSLDEFEVAAPPPGSLPSTRLAFAAAHLVLRPSYAHCAHSAGRPGSPDEIEAHIDWDTTMALRQHLDACGFGIAEAMDTAQRFELGWAGARSLIKRTGELNPSNGFVAGAGTDHLIEINSPADLIEGVAHQIQIIQQAGGIPIILPMPWLSMNDCVESTYIDVYRQIIEQSDGPLFIHWLGDMFLPCLKGYFPDDSFTQAMKLDPAKVRGAKLSLLDAELEVRLRRRLLVDDQIMLTGDDFNFARLIAGETDGCQPAGVDRWTEIGPNTVAIGHFSHALLGILDGIAEPAGLAFRLLDSGRTDLFLDLTKPLEELSGTIFEAPTQHYKVSLAFLAWLNGHQDNFMLVNHMECKRAPEHLLRVARLAARAGALTSPGTARTRLEQWMQQFPCN